MGNQNLSGAQFHQFKRTKYRIEPGDYDPENTVRAVNERTGKQVGFLAWHSPTAPQKLRNSIQLVEVDKPHRSRGVATEMLKHARGMNPDVRHSESLTPEGKAWNESLQRRGVE